MVRSVVVRSFGRLVRTAKSATTPAIAGNTQTMASGRERWTLPVSIRYMLSGERRRRREVVPGRDELLGDGARALEGAAGVGTRLAHHLLDLRANGVEDLLSRFGTGRIANRR